LSKRLPNTVSTDGSVRKPKTPESGGAVVK